MYYNIAESGQRIKELRISAGMTRRALAEQLGISIDALRKIEKGTNGAKIDTFIALAENFHISLDYLICGKKPKEKEEEQDLFAGLEEREIQHIQKIIKSIVKLVLLK